MEACLKITRIEPFILHVPVTRGAISDSTHSISHWGAPGVIIHTDSGLRGFGYTGTHAHLPTDRLITRCISETYGPLLLNEDPHEVLQLWDKLYYFPPSQWVGRSGITQLALSAVDIALWDLKAKAAALPLWKLLGGGAGTKITAYNTDGGWLSLSTRELVDSVRRQVEEEGYDGVKLKVGSPEPHIDLERIEAVRKAIGHRPRLMIDANGRWDLPTAMSFGRKLDPYDIYWLEEPIWYDDVLGHAALAHAISTPIALGEQLYSLDHFQSFIAAGGMHYVQADAVRLAGISEWWRVADLAHAHRLPVAPHIGDMMQVHLHLAIAHPACNLLEYIPWLRECFEEPATVREGQFVVPERPGAGTEIRLAALERYNVL